MVAKSAAKIKKRSVINLRVSYQNKIFWKDVYGVETLAYLAN